MRSAVLAAAFAALLAGCVSVNKSVLSQSRLSQPVPRDSVHVYLPGDSVPEHERIAILTAKGDENTTNESQMIDRMRQEAGKLGANAIILQDMRDPNNTARVLGAVLGTPSNRKGQAIAVYVPALARTGQ
jgi:type IV pilus biogenesis protein CpaD/CtpE